MELQREEAIRKLDIQTEVNRKKEAEAEASKQAEKDLQVVIDEIANAQRERTEKDSQQRLALKRAEAEIEKAKQDAYAQTVATIIASIGPELAAALVNNANNDLAKTLTSAVAPYAIAKGESVADVANKMMRGLPLDEAIQKYKIDISGKIEIDGYKSDRQRFEDAEKYFKLGKYEETLQLCEEIGRQYHILQFR